MRVLVFVPPDHYLWDFWFAPRRPGKPWHLFYLQAPRSLPDPELRHAKATIGHAVSLDLVHWEEVGTAFTPGPPGSWDDRAIWTGSILRHDGRYYFFYTGTSVAERGAVQRIGLATATDLRSWRRAGDGPVVQADPRWYRTLGQPGVTQEDCRDPWVVPDPAGGGWLMFFTASARDAEPDGRGVVGLARSRDLLHWEADEPVCPPGDFGEIEVPQVVALEGRYYLLFCTAQHSAARVARTGAAGAWNGTAYLTGFNLTGPYLPLGGEPLVADADGRYYGGRVVAGFDDRLVFFAWRKWDDEGRFLGGLSNPAPLRLLPDGRLQVDAEHLWPGAAGAGP